MRLGVSPSVRNVTAAGEEIVLTEYECVSKCRELDIFSDSNLVTDNAVDSCEIAGVFSEGNSACVTPIELTVPWATRVSDEFAAVGIVSICVLFDVEPERAIFGAAEL